MPLLWMRLAPVITLSIFLTSLTAPFDVWVNVMRGDYPPRAWRH